MGDTFDEPTGDGNGTPTWQRVVAVIVEAVITVALFILLRRRRPKL